MTKSSERATYNHWLYVARSGVVVFSKRAFDEALKRGKLHLFKKNLFREKYPMNSKLYARAVFANFGMNWFFQVRSKERTLVDFSWMFNRKPHMQKIESFPGPQCQRPNKFTWMMIGFFGSFGNRISIIID